MPEIGETLRDARMRARIDVSEIEAKTKIRAKYLRALENEEWGLLPGPTFVKSFLRTYAQALDLDGKAPTSRLLPVPGRTVERVRTVEVDGRRFEVRLTEPEAPWLELARRRRERVSAGAAGGTDVVVSPMQGTVLSVAVAEGDEVEAGALICIVEAMKMENEVHAHRAGVVAQLSVAPGDPVATGQVICVISG